MLAIPRLPLADRAWPASLALATRCTARCILIGLLGWPFLMRAHPRPSIKPARARFCRSRPFARFKRQPYYVPRNAAQYDQLRNVSTFILSMTFAMYEQVALVVLGLAPINDYTWGIMIFFGRVRVGHCITPMVPTWPCRSFWRLPSFRFVWSSLPRALEEIFDPRLRTAF